MNKTIVRVIALALAAVMFLGLLVGIVMADEYNPGQNRDLYSSAEFEAEFTYEGDDLGAVWTAGSTTFRVWAPTADSVAVRLYSEGLPSDFPLDTVLMTPDVNGTWVATVEGDLNGVYYTYAVRHGDEVVEALHMIPVHSIEEGLQKAKAILNKDNITVTAIPDGVSVMVLKEESV